MRVSAISSGPTGRRLRAAPSPLALGILLSLLACGDSQSTPSGSLCDDRPIRIGVASSLREIAETVTTQLTADRPTIEIESIYGASSTHARQLRLGAPFDVLVSADAELMASLEDANFIDRVTTREIARGQLILISRATLEQPAPDSPSETIFSRGDLRRVAVPSEVVPLGRYARAWLRERNLLKVLDGKIVTTEHARASLSAVETGHVDLAFAYGSDRRLLRNARFLTELKAEDYPPIRYVAARTARASGCGNAGIVLAAWSSPSTQSALGAAGFVLPTSRAARP